MTVLCDTLLNLLNKKFAGQATLEDYEWKLLHQREEIPDEDEAAENSEGDSSVVAQIRQAIKQKQQEIESLESEITDVARRVLQSPLCLIPVPQEHSPFLQCLERAKINLEDLESGRPEHVHSITSAAWNEIERATELLKLGQGGSLADQALVLLFRAGVSAKQGNHEYAQKCANEAFRYFPDEDQPHRLAVRLLQGNIYSTSTTGRVFEGANAYDAAIRRLERLQRVETERGNRGKAELYRVLKEQLQQSLSKSRLWKVVPPSFDTLHIIGEEAAGQERYVSHDNIIGHITYTDEGKFEIEGRPLTVHALKGNRLSFQEGYDYVALQVTGDSMDRAGISPNDYAVLQRQNHKELKPTPGDIVAVVFRDEKNKQTILSRIKLGSSGVTLQPESSNPEHQPHTLPPKDFAGDPPPVQIVGIAVAVLKH